MNTNSPATEKRVPLLARKQCPAPDSRGACPAIPSSRRKRVPLLARKQCQRPSLGTRPSSLQSPASSLRTRSAFTLTELLIVIVIIGMLAGISLGALYSARQTGRVQRTKATIAKLDRIIQAKYTDFLSRRLPIRNRRVPPDAMDELRVRVLHEIMRLEMPDRLTDITYPRSNTPIQSTDIDATFNVDAGCRAGVGSAGNSEVTITEYNIGRTALARRYFRQAVASSDFLYGPDPNYAPAECLYLIVAADPEAREQFQPTEIGDADEDGFFEFHDGWGNPIMFIRWAPGFPSEMQTGDAQRDHDPTDPRRIGEMIEQSNGNWERPTNTTMFRLVPLIYSAGPDGEYGINLSGDWIFQYEAGNGDREPIDRVWIHTDSNGFMIGEPVPTPEGELNTHYDNITNHSLGMN